LLKYLNNYYFKFNWYLRILKTFQKSTMNKK